jgi:hypothetical protein
MANFTYLNSAEIFDPATNAWQPTSDLQQKRVVHTATLLTDGRVLVTGGMYSGAGIGSAEVYDPGAGTWQTAGPLPQGRNQHTATVLANGQVLIAGGLTNGAATALLYGGKLGVSDSRRPRITTAPAQVAHGSSLQLGGLRFTGDSEGSGGGFSQSASNVPLVRMQRVDNEEVYWIAAENSNATTFTGQPMPTGVTAGWYQLTLFVNGMASDAVTLRVLAGGAPNAPTNVNATPGDGRVTVSWQPPLGGTPPTSYTVTAQPGGASCTVQAPATSCTVTGLTNGTAYTFTVTANAAGGNASSAPSSAVTPAPGPVPSVQGIPTLSEWGLVVLSVLMAAMTVFHRRRIRF